MDSKIRYRKEASKMPVAIQTLKNNVAHRGVDDLKHQIGKLTSDLSSERTRNRELHREKLTELKRAKNELEIHKEKAALIIKTLDSNVDSHLPPKRDLTFHKQADYSWHESQRSPPVGGEVSKSRTSSSSSHRPLSSVYVSTIANLQQELHLLRNSKKQLEQRLAGIEDDQPFIQFDRSYNGFDSSIQSIEDNFINATPSSVSPQFFRNRTSDKSNSTFIIESEFERDEDELQANRHSQSVSSVGSEQSVDKQVKGDSEKQWQLQKKVLDLSAQSAQLEKRITSLKEENDVLKKKTDEQKENEEKVKKLKRRNAELASIARRLEDKVKQIQQDSQKKTLAASPSVEITSKQMAQNKTRTKDRTVDKSKGAVNKDKLIDVMKERFQELLRQNRSAHAEDLLNKDFYAEQMELENIIKVAAKERLQLEKQLVDEQHNLEIEAQLTKAVHLERRNAELMDEIERLTKFADEREKLEIEVMQRRIEVETLEQQVTEANDKCTRLADELQDLIIKNTQLTVVNTDVQRQIEELDHMAKNYKSLSTSLAAAESELLKAKAEAASSSERVQTLEVELQYMGQVEQKKRQLELEKQSLQESLRTKQQEVDAVSKDREKDNMRNKELLKSLELRLSEIENLYEEQLRINEQISRELNDVRASNEKRSGKPARYSIEVQTELELLITDVTVSHESLLPPEAINGHFDSASKDRHHSKSKVVEMDFNRNNHCANNLRLTDLISKDELSVAAESRSQVLHETANRVITKGTAVNGSPVENGYADDAVLNDEILNGQESLIQVFQALFDYDPDQSSPNEEPEQELVLTAGDYMFVYNNMDEDGFYLAELLDGRQGLVPSNFVRRVTGQELDEFYAAINLDMQGDGVDPHSGGTNPLLDFREDSDQSGSTNAKRFSSVVPEDADRSLDVSFTNDGQEVKQPGIPDAPVSVQVESGPDHGCLMVSWLPVTITTAGTSNGARLAGYYIYIDGCKVKTLSNPTGDHVLLESDDLCLISDPRCITVRTVAVSGQESSDSLPAFIFPHLVQELRAGSVSVEDDNVAVHDEREDEYVTDQASGSETERPETANHSSDPIPIPQPLLRPENGNHLPEVENTNPSNNQLKEAEQMEDMDDHRHEEILPTENVHHSVKTSSAHSILQTPKSPELVPATAASSVDAAVGQSDGDVALKGAFTSTVWKKVTPKTKLNTTVDTADLDSVNWDNDKRTWKSLDSGDPQVLSSKSQSQECLSGTKRSGWVRNTSLMNVNVDGEAPARHMEISAANAKETLERTETQKNRHGIPVSTSLIAKDKLQQQRSDSQDIDNTGGKKLGVSRVVRNRDISTSSELSANNGISFNELDDGVSSGSELIDNNMMTSKKIRDDIPDSELIDYSDDGGESLVESMDCDRDAPVRIFIALFSYDPETMSPNPDALTEELPFREGQIIKIYGDKDQDGFFVGEINHQRGLVPCNMVSEVHINDPEIAAQLLEESRRTGSRSAGSSRTSSRTSEFTSRTHSTISNFGVPDDERLSPVGEPSDIDDNVPERYVIALYNYDPQELSPNTDAEEELSFQKGDIIKVFGEVDEDGFYYGQLNDRYGLVPSNFIKEAPSSAVYYAVAMQNRPSL